jgi:LmbE family N-acetylglucosaminyl deacetylase
MVVAFAPHPDDEVLGAGATLLHLQEAGERVTVVCAPPKDPARAGEFEESCRRLGVADARVEPEVKIPGGCTLVLGPQPGDGHPAHERMARAIATALAKLGDAAPRWWQWGLWRDLPSPTRLTAFDEERMAVLEHALSAHASQLDRGDFIRLLRGRAMAAAVLGPERIHGYGAPGISAPYAELLTEVPAPPPRR